MKTLNLDYTALHKELDFRATRSSGSGGQHINKVATRVELIFRIPDSQVLTEQQQRRLQKVLSNRINKEGELLVASQNRRSQALNKKEAVRKFDRLVEKALRPAKKRKGPKKKVADPKKRLEAKRRRSEQKALRKKVKPQGRA